MSSWEMMKLRVLLLVFCWMACVEGDEGKAEPPGSTCEMYTDMKTFFVTEGEALRIVPDGLQTSNWNDFQHDQFIWHRHGGETNFSSLEEERIHQHGPALFFLPLSINDTGLYIARLDFLGKCHIFHVPLHVKSASDPLETFYTPIESSDSNPQVVCPEQVTDVCKDFRGVLRWYQNSSLMVGEKLPTLQLQGYTMPYAAVYKCVCTWKHNEKPYNSTASRELKMEQPANQDIKIILPTTTELTVHQGLPLEIQCVVYFRTNFKRHCEVHWEKNNRSISGMDGYQQTFFREMEGPSNNSFCSSTLTIEKVQGSDLQTSFRCRASNHRETRFHTLRLKLAEPRSYLVVAVVCVSIVFLLSALTVKHFFMDLVLFGRRLRCCKACNDGSRYDIYVVYHSQEKSEGILNRFLSQALPHVLEQKCGYRVFIHGPNDTPRADRLEVVKEHVRLCRTLMVVLPPGLEIHETLGSSPSSPVGDNVEWQVGLHEALAQDTRVILVQLGEVGPQGYTHLSPTLQNFIHKRSPLCWWEDSSAADWNSRFWKRVRYEMPMVSAKPSSLSVL